MAYAVKNELGLSTTDFLEMNASDERKIEDIRTTVKEFARGSHFSDAPFKILLLDEIDGMPKVSQQALRRIMELFHTNVRFILTANNIGDVSEAVSSRCSVFQFRALHPVHMSSLLVTIANRENKSIPIPVISKIVELAEGDARLAINSLEAMMNLENPTEQDVSQFIGKTTEENIYHLLGAALKGDMKTFDIMKSVLDEGASASQILRQTFYVALSPRTYYTVEQRLRFIIHLGSLPASTEEMKLAAFLARVMTDSQLRK